MKSAEVRVATFALPQAKPARPEERSNKSTGYEAKTTPIIRKIKKNFFN